MAGVSPRLGAERLDLRVSNGRRRTEKVLIAASILVTLLWAGAVVWTGFTDPANARRELADFAVRCAKTATVVSAIQAFD